MSFGPADLAASRRMKTTRVGGGHPGYRVDRGPGPGRTRTRRARPPSRTRGTTRSRAWSTPARRVGVLPFYGPFGDIKDVEGCETQFRAAFLLGCVGAWSLHPVQIDIAKKVFSPDPDEVAFAKKVIEAIPDGRGVHMIDGKMQDDATWKQCKVMVDLAEMLARKDPELARGLRASSRPQACRRGHRPTRITERLRALCGKGPERARRRTSATECVADRAGGLSTAEERCRRRRPRPRSRDYRPRFRGRRAPEPRGRCRLDRARVGAYRAGRVHRAALRALMPRPRRRALTRRACDLPGLELRPAPRAAPAPPTGADELDDLRRAASGRPRSVDAAAARRLGRVEQRRDRRSRSDAA